MFCKTNFICYVASFIATILKLISLAIATRNLVFDCTNSSNFQTHSFSKKINIKGPKSHRPWESFFLILSSLPDSSIEFFIITIIAHQLNSQLSPQLNLGRLNNILFITKPK